jgi:hypothetical integral membrane protein (TIGR02206 family)
MTRNFKSAGNVCRYRVPVLAFAKFGPGHLTILAGTAALGVLLVAFARARGKEPVARVFERALAILMIVCYAADPYTHHLLGELDLAHALPLQLCDAAGIAAIVALLTRRQPAFELAYFWALAGATQALVTPPIEDGARTLDGVRYFVLHAAIVVTPLYLGPGLGMRPRRGAWWRAALLTMLFALLVGLADWALDANYMWLRESPPGSILDLFGPWPWYIAAGTAIGWILFFLLDLPYRLAATPRAA